MYTNVRKMDKYILMATVSKTGYTETYSFMFVGFNTISTVFQTHNMLKHSKQSSNSFKMPMCIIKLMIQEYRLPGLNQTSLAHEWRDVINERRKRHACVTFSINFVN